MLLLLSVELLLRLVVPEVLLLLRTAGELLLRLVVVIVEREVAVEVRGVATVTVSFRLLTVLTSVVLGRVLITSEVRVVVRVPVDRKDVSLRNPDSD